MKIVILFLTGEIILFCDRVIVYLIKHCNVELLIKRTTCLLFRNFVTSPCRTYQVVINMPQTTEAPVSRLALVTIYFKQRFINTCIFLCQHFIRLYLRSKMPFPGIPHFFFGIFSLMDLALTSHLFPICMHLLKFDCLLAKTRNCLEKSFTG